MAIGKAFRAFGSGWRGCDPSPLVGRVDWLAGVFRELGATSCRLCVWHGRNYCYTAIVAILIGIGAARLFGW